MEEAEQYLKYLKAHRGYLTLLQRYNPDMIMNEEERVQLTARKVGMDLPPEGSTKCTSCLEKDW